jgi:hypothetical protein
VGTLREWRGALPHRLNPSLGGEGLLPGKERAAIAMNAWCCVKVLNHEGTKTTKVVTKTVDRQAVF